jgi:ubiquinone/menaquinone biosynthesis C-methylase UbiE
MTNEREQYTMGYGPAATAIMARRTAQSHAAFFLPHLKPGMSLLDCGCGPGTITLSFAELVAPGQVVGTEIEALHVALARENAANSNVSNVRFETADIYGLPFEDASFDAVFISAVLSNLREPIRGLREAYRVLRPGGVIGIKEFDHRRRSTLPTGAGRREVWRTLCANAPREWSRSGSRPEDRGTSNRLWLRQSQVVGSL